MNEAMITRWNERVQENDTVWFLGDLSFGGNQKTEEVLRRLKGQKNLILGNHDYSKVTAYMGMEVFEKISIYEELEIDGRFIILFHYPISNWSGSHRGSIHLHGHMHSKAPLEFSGSLRRLDVGVDAWNYRPVSLEEVLEFI
jgi:calcineurin-like phosphoesterase family protein